MTSLTVSANDVEFVSIDGGEPRTTTLAVAKKFGKRHSDVLRAVRTAIKNDKNFKPLESQHIDQRGKSRPAYLLTPMEYELLEIRLTGHLRAPYGLREDIALSVIEQLLGIELIRQFDVGGYRVDGYDAVNNIAYEIDEQQHQVHSHRLSDKIRQEYIESEIGCKFVRIKV